ncbi:SpdD-like protein [Streptomyces olivaceus]|uniref:SpdD-like protein n=1 Tax=Streptomyces olivaceus TaxID=47716 RepID=UPI000878BC55|nr:SpdD-like protein [Streptomyces olivaceus]AOW87045.1 SpdD-like protein [Streptomyces olivaceus]MBZ6285061.1 SpdD-like protein [Streptomyces olivaceus]
MLRPKIPTNPTPAGHLTPPVVVEPTAVVPSVQGPPPAPVAPAPPRPTVPLTPGTALALVGGGTAVVLVVGAVLVSLLLAVAITGASVAVCALVIRSLVHADAKRR